jgi:ATP-dependent helicase/nuclease subunit B
VSKTLLLGRAGSGKTRRLLEAVAERVRAGTDDRAVLLVPTYGRAEHVKRALLGLLGEGTPGFLDRSVVTFTSLAERVLGGTAIAALVSPGTRDHLVRAALERARVPVFARVAAFPGFRARFLALVKEVKEAGLEAEAAQEALEALAEGAAGDASRTRIRGFAAVFGEYTAALRARGLVDHEDFQRELLRRLRESGDALPGSLARLEWLGVDGFHNFTRLQLDIVELLAERVPTAALTLPFDRARPELFAPSEETRVHLQGKGWRPEVLSGVRRADESAGDLRRLEATLFDEVAPDAAPADGSVRLLRCADPADEADRVARTAALWIRRDGLRPYDVLLVWRSLAAARSLLEEAFRRHGVPLRVFAPRPLAAEPLVRAALDLLRLRVGLADGETALRVLRSGRTVGTDLSEGDRLAEAVAERGVPDDGPSLRALAEETKCGAAAALLARLLPTDAEAAAAPRSPDLLAAEALADLAVPGLLEPAWLRRGRGAVASIDTAEASVEAAALAALAGLVTETARSFRREAVDAPVARRAFHAALEEAVARGTFAPPDRRLHAVNAVDVEEARQWEARAVIVGGLLERQFPRAPREDLLLRDADRERANRVGEGGKGLRFSLGLRSREGERLLFYVAATRARERLVLSWPAAGPAGERLLPSSFLEEVERLWPKDVPVLETRASIAMPFEGEELSRGDLLRPALLRATEPRAAVRSREAGAILDVLAGRGRNRLGPRIAEAALLSVGPVAALRRRRLRAGIASPFVTSASALSSHFQCRYLHFANHVLHLRSPSRDVEEGLDPLRLGTVVHAALEHWFAGGRKGDPATLFDEALAEAARGIRPGLDDHALALRARESVAAFARSEGARVDARPFQPRWQEHGFGMGEKGGAPALRLLVDRRRILVRGRFDRVDVAPDGTAVAVDYKMRAKEKPFDERALAKAEEGVDPQVLIYWLALRDALGLVPVGVELADVATGNVTGIRAEGAPESVAPSGKSVVRDAAGIAAMEEKVRAAAGRAATSLARGEISARPEDPRRCGSGFCDFADLCRHEKWDLRKRGRE